MLHLQCHFGLDSLARAGARVTGLDFSARAIDAARALAEELDLEARFVEGDVYDAGELIPARFDLVYVTWGTICWLPDIRGWARVAAAALRPGGRLFFADAHPFLLTLDDEKASAVESRRGAVAWALWASLRFLSPLINPDVRISRIRLPDRLHLKAHGGGPRWTRRRRITPNSPNATVSGKRMVPRDDTLWPVPPSP